jgi:hypothetical protein
LFKQNDEAKRRRSTKSIVVGKAKVMSYEDIEKAQAKRAKEAVKDNAAVKGKRSRKRKNSTQEVANVTTMQSAMENKQIGIQTIENKN